MPDKKSYIYGFIIVVLVFVIDRLTKDLILANPSCNISLIGGLLKINYVENTGVAFGFLKGYNSFFVIFNSILLIFLLYIRKRTKNPVSFYAFHIIIGGAVGNIFDRIKNGYVIDFIDLKYFPAVFNMADFFITLGVLILMFSGVKEE